jgi:hypothetical protein
MASPVSESQRTLQLLEEPPEEKPTSSTSVKTCKHGDNQEPNNNVNNDNKNSNNDCNNSNNKKDPGQPQENSNQGDPNNVKTVEEKPAVTPSSPVQPQSNQEEPISNSRAVGSPSEGEHGAQMNGNRRAVQEGSCSSPPRAQPQEHGKAVGNPKAVHERLMASSTSSQGNHIVMDPSTCLRSRFPIPAYPTGSGLGPYVSCVDRKEDVVPLRGSNIGRESGSGTLLSREQLRIGQENTSRQQEPVSIPRAVYERIMSSPFRQGFVQLQDSASNPRQLQALSEASQQWLRSHVINVDELMQSPNAVRQPGQANEGKKRKEREVTKVQKEELWPNSAVDALLRKFEDLCFNKHRGQLGKKHWDRIAAAVNVICGTDYTGMQCKYKWHRLKKMYNKEKQRNEPSKWAFFSTCRAHCSKVIKITGHTE